jgi:non-ribosomal peptide synthetase component F
VTTERVARHRRFSAESVRDTTIAFMGATQGTTLHELIAAQTRGARSRIAVTGPDGDLTYGELEYRAEQVAVRLAALGVGVDRPVGLLVPDRRR